MEFVIEELKVNNYSEKIRNNGKKNFKLSIKMLTLSNKEIEQHLFKVLKQELIG